MRKIYKILLKQNIGIVDNPIVSVGQRVKKGTLIAKANGLGADLHSSVSGKITEITDSFIIIDADAIQGRDFETIKELDNIVEIVKSAGIIGMGGAGFPTHIKLDTDLKGGTVIANAVECEPLLEHNIKQIIKDPQSIYRGMLYAMKATNANKGILAIKKKNKDAIEAFKKVIESEHNIKIIELEDIYPMGEERAVIRETLGVLLETDQLPLEAGAVVLNAETLGRITQAVELGKPVISKNITVVGKLKDEKQAHVFMDVPLGTTVKELLERAGGIDGNYGEIIMGGPFTGHSVELDDVITKTSGAIIVTMEFMNEKRNMGLLVCACGGNEDRLREIAGKMNAKVVGVEKCKQAIESKGTLKCKNPGNCPGQAEKILSLKKRGAEVVLISNCSDCTNTVMCVAPKLKMPVYHCTDHVMRTVNHSLIRRLK
ncbi:proline reductase-associated electron transfer protein PrdC [Clostridium frigidicarnis]|uniref:Proline reductase-associated electron transfer protein PrdC n=1 Tax=Clostridium frigidicarnis TaxID=84698 RepID=A0A1I0X333_9CLOT|nr:proline reductase-associated electron transfer protein PrdC [Clostridium frigidicarnis]SFA95439.1 proline reductase-associated electron transfer protein PrdC [Clostridium frigidicarnis]